MNEKELTKDEKLNISLTDISKIIKKQLKKEYPKCKFSVRCQFYSGGSSLHLSVLETDFKVIMPFEDISEHALNMYKNRNYSFESIKDAQNKGYCQINEYQLNEEYNKDLWNNGIFLTEKGFKLVKRISEMSKRFNWDNSDSQIDYFDVKFYTHLNLGKWDKPLIESV